MPRKPKLVVSSLALLCVAMIAIVGLYILDALKDVKHGSVYETFISGQSLSMAPQGKREGEKNETGYYHHPAPTVKLSERNFTSSDSNPKPKQTDQQKAELNYIAKFRQVQFADYSKLFSYDDQGYCQGLSCKWPRMPGATRKIVKSAPEVFEKVPLSFLENFKNPCWVHDDAELNCLPYFYIIGMPKCGTTDVWDKIVAHPDVVNVPKEPHWWGPRRHGFIETPCHREEVLQMRAVTGGKDDSSLEWYLNLYKSTAVPVLINKTLTNQEGRPYHQMVFGDASISTSNHIGDWTKSYPNVSEPLFTNADLIGAVQPNAKIIMMVRNPTDRGWSWYWFGNHGTKNSTAWHDFVLENIKCFQECLKTRTLRYCAYVPECPHSWIPELQVSIYHVYLRDWINAFSRDRVLVIRLEDWKADSLGVYRQILEFLDLRQISDEEEQLIINQPHGNVNTRIQGHMLPATRKILDDFYRSYNKELASLLNDDKFLYSSS